MSNISLERYYFVLYDGALTLKMSKMALKKKKKKKNFSLIENSNHVLEIKSQTVSSQYFI